MLGRGGCRDGDIDVRGGLFSGLLHAALQWATTGVTVADGCITTRNLFWVRHIATSEIEAVHRLRRDRWRGVSVALVDGTEVVLAAPSANAIALNPHFDEDVHRLCATIARRRDGSSEPAESINRCRQRREERLDVALGRAPAR